jgi:NAD(P)-dependent dehydrogenase (short-subunit alcohol dehydrogenase family)
VSQAASRAVVVGGASGIGWAVARGLAAEGRHVTVADRNAEGAAEKARELGAPHGFVDTPLTELVTMAPGVIEDYVENTPLGRVGVPEDVAEAVLFLCSGKASWLTGEVLDLNGGAHLKRYPDVLAHVDRMASA